MERMLMNSGVSGGESGDRLSSTCVRSSALKNGVASSRRIGGVSGAQSGADFDSWTMTGDCAKQHDFELPAVPGVSGVLFAQQSQRCASRTASTLHPTQPGQMPLGTTPPHSATNSKPVETIDLMPTLYPVPLRCPDSPYPIHNPQYLTLSAAPLARICLMNSL
jgi:hypothetical protein